MTLQGPYTLYILAAYGIFGVGLLGILWVSLRQWQSASSHWHDIQKQAQAEPERQDQ